MGAVGEAMAGMSWTSASESVSSSLVVAAALRSCHSFMVWRKLSSKW